MPEAPYGGGHPLADVLLVDPDALRRHRGATSGEHLEAADIEARPVWKPMHLQPLFSGAECVGGAVAEELFQRGLCLPSGSSLSDADRARVIETVLRTPRTRDRARAESARRGPTPCWRTRR